jgi:hypothetical protein
MGMNIGLALKEEINVFENRVLMIIFGYKGQK